MDYIDHLDMAGTIACDHVHAVNLQVERALEGVRQRQRLAVKEGDEVAYNAATKEEQRLVHLQGKLRNAVDYKRAGY